jgi:Prolipoprotein diacylglyceryl transferase
MEFTLLAAAAIGVFSFWLMLRWEAPRGNAAGCSVDLWDAGLLAATGGLFAGRLAAMLQSGINPFTDPAQIILIRSGVSTPMSVMATIGIFALLSRSTFLIAADGISAAALAGIAGWHAGCLTTGSCLGAPSGLPWAFPLEGGSIDRHPVEIYAAIAMAAGAIGIAVWKAHGRPPLGAPAGAAALVASTVMLATEPLRISLGGGPVWVYAAGIVVGTAMVVFAIVRTTVIHQD